MYLYKGAFNLSDINGWVEALANVHDDVSAEDLVVASQTVNLHHRASAAKCEVCTIPFAFLKVEIHVWGSVDEPIVPVMPFQTITTVGKKHINWLHTH